MTIAELFIRIGFKVDGAGKMEESERGIRQATVSATKLTLKVAALNAAFFAMIATSMKAATALRNFAASTGLSTDELQRWQRAAQMAGIDAGDLTSAVKGLQTARTNFALGEPEAVGAWALLGVDPRQDPFKVIESLRERLKTVSDVGIARNLLGRVGMEDMLPLLRSTNAEFEKWQKNFLITTQQQEKLGRLTAAWASLKAEMVSIRTQFSALFVPVLTRMAAGLEWVAAKVAIFVKWLERGGPVATAVRWALQGLALLLPIIAAGALAVTTALAGLAAIMGVITALSWASGLAEIILALTAIAAIVTGLILLLDDMWAAFTGKKSALADLGDKIFGPLFWKGFEALEWIKTFFGSSATWAQRQQEVHGLPKVEPRPYVPGGILGQVRQENHVSIQVDGAKDPKATGREVANSVKREISGASYQVPVPSY